MVRKHIDGAWFERSLADGNLAHWLSAAVTDSGFFRVSLDRRWRPTGEAVGTLVSQSRLLYAFAAGWQLTRDERYRAAVRGGAEFLLRHFRDAEHGGWAWSCDERGAVLDDEKNTYGHAFVILGLSHAYRATGDERFRSAARETWEVVRTRLRDAHGGYVWHTTRDFAHPTDQRSQNPMMHLFESLLALYDVSGEKAVFDGAGELLGFLFGRLYQPSGGYLPEAYDPDWRPLPDQEGGLIDVGHQFEWAYLLSEAVQRGLPPAHLATGRQLLETGMRLGYDDAAGGIVGSVTYDGTPRTRVKGWWQQCELLRALMRYAARHEQPELWEPFTQSLEFAKRYLMDFEFGGWYESFDPTRPDHTPTHKGSIWKAGYHVTGMHVEALRLVGRLA